MAGNRIKGITIEIGGNTTKLTDSLKNVDKSLKDTQSKLKDVNKLLKLDPSNIELLRQKHDLLSKAVDDTKKRQEELKKALEDAKNSGDTKYTQEQQNALQRELIETTQDLKQLQDALNHSSPLLEAVSAKTGEWSEKTRKMSTAAAGLGAAMIGNAYSAALAVDDLNTLSKQTGFTVEELQKMQYASALVDVDFNTMTGSIAKLTKNMANGSDAFGKLGISVKDEMTGQLRDANTVWYETLWALSKVQNETERDALAMELFGKSAADLSGIVDDGGVALMSYGSEAEELGLILSQDNVDAANKFNDAMDQLKARTSAAFLEAGASLAETLVPALEKLVEIATQVLTWFANLDGGTQAFILTVLALVAAISPILGIISALTGAAAALNVAMLPMIATIGGIILAVGAVVAAGVLLYQNWDTIKQKASELWSSITTTFDNIKTSISEKIESARQTVSDAVEKIKGIFNFSWSLPPIKVPHFSVSGGEPPWGIMGKGSLPKISISWYRKAYDDAVLFNQPTIIPTIGGLKGFGDGPGSELVIGVNKLREVIGTSGNNININVYAAPGMDETTVANAVAVKLDRWLGERL
jgi:phage-related minor tail protein